MKRTNDRLSEPTYGAMGNDKFGYEPSYSFHEEWMHNGLHCHDFYEIFIHYRGGTHYCIDNRAYSIKPYQLIIIPPFVMHGNLANQVYHNYERAFLYITPHTLSQVAANILDLNSFLSSYLKHGAFMYQMEEEDALLCRQLLQDMVADFEDESQLGRLDNQRKLMHFIQLVCSTLQRSEPSQQPIVVNEAMQDVLSYINGNFTQPMKLETLARQFGISVSYLSHGFVKYTGRSVYDYILYRRVLHAKELLYSDMPLSEIAEKCGFTDYSSFLRSFKKMAGVSPKEYRQQQLVICGGK